MNNLWLLLLPFNAVFSFIRIIIHKLSGAPKSGPAVDQYLKGLTYLINDESDKAVNLFVKMLQVDNDTIETHLALGHLYRRRGEVDRAIRVHQNLISRPNLNRDQRSNALYALARDYLSAGLLDRAERLLLELVELGGHLSSAHEALLYIYQQEKEWDKAIQIAQTIEKRNKDLKMDMVIAQFHCELANTILRKSNEIDVVKKHLEKALNINSLCARASIKLGDLAMQQSDFRAALMHYQQVETQRPDFLHLVIPKLQDVYSSLGKTEEFIEYMQKISQRFANLSLISPLSELLRQYYGDHAALHLIKQHTLLYPSLSGLHEWISLQVSTGTQKTELEDMLFVTKNLIKQHEELQCISCGFSSTLHYWQCPSCKQWETITIKNTTHKQLAN